MSKPASYAPQVQAGVAIAHSPIDFAKTCAELESYKAKVAEMTDMICLDKQIISKMRAALAAAAVEINRSRGDPYVRVEAAILQFKSVAHRSAGVY